MKKSISFVLVAFLILLGAAKSNVVSAQGKSADQYTWVHDGTGSISVPFNSDGVTENVWVETEFRCVCHWVNGEQVWMHMWYDFTFKYNGETFTAKEKQDYGWIKGVNWNDEAYYTAVSFVCNVKGDKGTHILASGTIDWWWTGNFTIDKFIKK